MQVYFRVTLNVQPALSTVVVKSEHSDASVNQDDISSQATTNWLESEFISCTHFFLYEVNIL
jgi:hypothetical protein